MTIRVQIPVYADYWMRGDRYGELVKTKTMYSKIGDKWADGRLVGYVKLDKSGKTIRVLLDDCEWLPK